MNFWANIFYGYRRIIKALRLFLIISGPGIIVMLADNDAGGITTYAATGAKYGYNLIWFLVILLPVAYYVQEMTVRLGAVTKRGHAEAIFSAFGPFWGWFSLIDLALVNWLTLITEFIGMTAALSIFHVPPVATILIVAIAMLLMVLQGRYWTWEKIAIGFAILNLIYIPGAFIVHPSVSSILHNGIIPHFPGGFSNDIFFFLMANIGTTIAPWMIFFQQSAVVDKGLQEKDIRWEKIDTLMGSFFTVLVAIFIVIVTGTVLHGVPIESAAQAARKLMGTNRYLGEFLAIGLFDAGFLDYILNLFGATRQHQPQPLQQDRQALLRLADRPQPNLRARPCRQHHVERAHLGQLLQQFARRRSQAAGLHPVLQCAPHHQG